MNLNQITVPSLDLTKSIPFYEKIGLKLIVKSLPHYARFVCPDGNSTFSIHQTDELPKGDGIYVSSIGDRYEGSWKNDMKHDYGKYDFADGSAFLGYLSLYFEKLRSYIHCKKSICEKFISYNQIR